MIEAAIMCLALNIYFEARSEPIQGQIAVAEVTLNRVASKHYPNDICGVVLQENKDGCQFSWWCDGKSDKPRENNSLETSKAIAELMLKEGKYISVVGKDATHYHTDRVNPYWAKDFYKIKQIGKHIFYKMDNNSIEIPLPRPENFESIIENHKESILKEQNY